MSHLHDPNSSFFIRPGQNTDPAKLKTLLMNIHEQGVFTQPEVDCAFELINLALSDLNSGYQLLIATSKETDQVLGYICYGHTPMTKSTWDLYWIASDPSSGRRGIGTALLYAMEKEVASQGGHLVRLETGSHEGHGAARKFYEKHGYTKAGQIDDFYKPGDDLLIFVKKLAV